MFICTKKIQNMSRNGWIMAIFSLRGWVIPLSTTWDKVESFGVHLYQKDPKSAKKWLSYCHFLPERLRDSIGKHMGQKGILWCLFVPKRSKIAQEMAELGPFSLLRGWVIPLTSTSLLMHHCIIVSGKWLGDSRTAKFLSGSHKKVNWSPQEEKEQEELQWSVANCLFLGKPVKMVFKKIRV